MITPLLRLVRFLALPTLALCAAACGEAGFQSLSDEGSESGGSSAAGTAGSNVGSAAGMAEGEHPTELGSGGSGSHGAGAPSMNLGKAGSNSAGGSSDVESSNAGSSNAGSSNAGSSHAGSGSAGSSHAGSGNVGSGGSSNGGSSSAGSAGSSTGGQYLGPSIGRAKQFAALAYSAITTANISPHIGDLGVSAGAVSTITGFDAPTDFKYGIDSLAPNSQLSALAQQDVTALVGNIDPRPCDADYTSVPGGLTGDITLHPGVTCMNSFANDVLLNGHVTLDAGGNPNAFFIIRGNLTLTVADAAQVVLSNGAQACGVFWRISKQVTIGKTVKFYGSVIAGSAITMKTGSTLVGRALAQTEGVHLDANTVTIPGACTHVQ